jgi:hypothetical protein
VALVRDRADILLKKAEADELHELLAQQARIRSTQAPVSRRSTPGDRACLPF